MNLDVLLRSTADGVCGVNASGDVALWTPSAEKILGYSAQEVMGRSICEFFVERDAPENRLCYRGCHVLTLVKERQLVQRVSMATRTRAGEPVWLDIDILVVPDGRRDASCTLHLFRDVTTARDIEALVRERLAQAQRATPPAGGQVAELTRRELEILSMLASGANTRKMAEQLHVSRTTVRNHVQSILGKLGVHSRIEAAAYATRHRLL